MRVARQGKLRTSIPISLRVVAVAAVVLCMFIRFLRSMIPHRAGAVLMCEHAFVRDTESRRLCQNIIAGQEAEIDQMKTILRSSRD